MGAVVRPTCPSSGDSRMDTYLFGPVPSRRLGMSLGIDLVPHKTCTMNCVYCECGATTVFTTRRGEYVPIHGVLQELRGFLDTNPAPDYCTLSGSGEPTLHRDIGSIIRFIKGEYPGQRVAVLTNGSLLSDPQVRMDLYEADLVLPSLDAATERTFRRIDRPFPGLNIEEYIQGMADFCREFPGTIWLEVMILPGYNDNPKDLARLKEAVVRINPHLVQLNTLDRPGTVETLRAAPEALLRSIAEEWSPLVPTTLITTPATRATIPGYQESKEQIILSTLARRPCTLRDLQSMLNLHPNQVNKHLSVLEARGTIQRNSQDRGVFYRLIKPRS